MNSDDYETLNLVRRRVLELENRNKDLTRKIRQQNKDIRALERSIGCPECAFLRRHLPAGSLLRECYETADEFIILGYPGEDETHDCDALGCSSVSHVLVRVPKGLEQATTN